jgi:hypothetical protein
MDMPEKLYCGLCGKKLETPAPVVEYRTHRECSTPPNDLCNACQGVWLKAELLELYHDLDQYQPRACTLYYVSGSPSALCGRYELVSGDFPVRVLVFNKTPPEAILQALAQITHFIESAARKYNQMLRTGGD